MKTKTRITSILSIGILATTGVVLAKDRNSPISPILPPQEINLAHAELGKKLFFEPRLSRSGFISCHSCHNLSRGGSDNLKTSIGHNWQQGPINSPTVLNANLNFVQFWDGRAADLKEQAAGPIDNPLEMAFTHNLAIEVLASIPQYVNAFRLAFGTDSIDMNQVTTALAEFQKTLATPNSRFDQWLLGDDDVLTKKELAGYELFKNSGCIACHAGEALGGDSFQKMGLIEPYITAGLVEGRIAVTGKDADRFKFKVPALRNVELTYPYFHDGEAESLTEAVDVMGRLQLGRKYTEEENAKIVAFLKTLTGDQPFIVLPILPPSTDETIPPTPFE